MSTKRLEMLIAHYRRPYAGWTQLNELVGLLLAELDAIKREIGIAREMGLREAREEEDAD